MTDTPRHRPQGDALPDPDRTDAPQGPPAGDAVGATLPPTGARLPRTSTLPLRPASPHEPSMPAATAPSPAGTPEPAPVVPSRAVTPPSQPPVAAVSTASPAQAGLEPSTSLPRAATLKAAATPTPQPPVPERQEAASAAAVPETANATIPVSPAPTAEPRRPAEPPQRPARGPALPSLEERLKPRPVVIGPSMSERGRFLLATLCGLILALAVHLVIVLLVPRFAAQDAYSRLRGTMESENAVLVSGTGRPETWVPLPDPAAAIAACAYDLEEGPVRITARTGSLFQSLTFHARGGGVFFAITDRAAVQGEIQLVVMTRRQLDEALASEDEAEPSRHVRIVAPRREGFVIVRSVAPAPSLRPQAEETVKAVSCTIEGDEPPPVAQPNAAPAAPAQPVPPVQPVQPAPPAQPPAQRR